MLYVLHTSNFVPEIIPIFFVFANFKGMDIPAILSAAHKIPTFMFSGKSQLVEKISHGIFFLSDFYSICPTTKRGQVLSGSGVQRPTSKKMSFNSFPYCLLFPITSYIEDIFYVDNITVRGLFSLYQFEYLKAVTHREHSHVMTCLSLNS